MSKAASLVITVALLIGLAVVFLGQPSGGLDAESTKSGENVMLKDGVQYVTILARGGYSPKLSVAQANVPTKLIIKTDGTYDCSAAVTIRSIGYKKILPPVGEEVVDLGTRTSGEEILGNCVMGMYGFTLRFE